MLPRFHAKDFLTVGHYLGLILAITGALMLVPATVSAFAGERACGIHFVFGAGLSLFVGSLLFLLKASRLDRRRSLLLCGFAWVIVAFFCAVPMFLSGDYDSFLSAYFDSVSVLTSTGVTSLEDVDHLSYSQTTWRAVMSLGGAQAIIIIALYLGFFGDGGYSARDNARARQDSVTASLRNTGRSLWVIMATVVTLGTVVLGIVLWHDGMDPIDAFMNGFWLTGNAFSTGSFVPHTSSLIYYHSTILNFFIAALMILGSINFAILFWHMNRTDDAGKVVWRNSELRAYALWLLILTVVVTIIVCREGIYTTLAGLFDRSTFMVVTAATTSGMQTIYPGQMGGTFPGGALILIMAAMVIGGCSCSTAGGLKMFRALQVLRWFVLSVNRNLLPDSVQVSVRYHHFGTKRATSGDAMLAMVVTTLFVIAAAMGAAVFIAHGYGALDAICESISYVTNTGVGVGVEPVNMGADLKLIAMLMMWAGRLEFIALIAAFFSLVTSLRPMRNNIPSGVSSSRSAQRKERLQQWGRRLKSKLLLEDSGTKAISALLVLAIALSLTAAPQALAASSTASGIATTDVPSIELTHGYRKASIAELLNATSRMDGDYVQVKGEVIGYPVHADSTHVWLNIRGKGGNMIAVLVYAPSAEAVTTYGRYGVTGDTITVRGIYNRACKKHAGELEVHALDIEITKEGEAWEPQETDFSLSVAGLSMLLASLALFIVERIWRGKPHIRILRFLP